MREEKSRQRPLAKNGMDSEREENKTKSKRTHSELARKSLGASDAKEKNTKKIDFACNDTTRYRRVDKKLARFCDFLLTDNPHGLILPIQIRGT